MKRRGIFGLICIAVLVLMAGCNSTADKPIQLTLWHVYGEQVDSPINQLIEEFNRTVGAENHVSVSVTAVSNSNKIHEAVLAAANNEPGAPELPDLFNAYPKTVSAMRDPEILVDYHDYFSEDELSDYVPAFLNEGEIDGRFAIFPVAKSTEVLYINKTLFDRFAAETGARLDDLTTWEGLCHTATAYTAWSDAKTPDVPNDGKAFFVHDYLFHYFQVGVRSLGEEFFRDNDFSFSPAYRTVWEPLARAAFAGGVWYGAGYATEPLRTGDVVASVASSASVLYYENIVTYDDNTSEDVEIIALPTPVFQNGKKMVMQRGGGFCTVRSTPERERAACLFLKWLTAPENNARFVTQLGYIPVRRSAHEGYMEREIATLSDPKYRSLYQVIEQINPSYEFVYPPQFGEYLDKETAFVQTIRNLLEKGRAEYLTLVQNGADPNVTLDQLTDKYFEALRAALQ